MINEHKSSCYPEIEPYKQEVCSPYNELCGIQKRANAQAKSAIAHIAFLPTLE